jgi:hypothetical protein
MPAMDRPKRPLAGHRRRLTLLLAATVLLSPAMAGASTAPPTRPGQHRATGKPIAPLAPAAEPARFTVAAKTEKWFRRNCNDVLGRECSAGEKADVLAWLMGLRP